MRFSNRGRITLVAFLCYFVLSGLLAPIGIVSGPMAERFSTDVTTITRQFSWLTGGNFLGALLALVVFDWIPLKRLLLGIYGVIAAGLLSFALIDSLDYARWVLALAGLGSGLGLPAAALTVSRTYDGEQRASLLVITDGCFSVAGFVCGWLANGFMALEWGWSSSYQFVGLVALLIVALAATSQFPATTRHETGSVDRLNWPLPVWLCIAALFLYTLGQYSMLFWLPNYVSEQLAATPVLAGSLVGQFWLGMFLAQVFVAWWVYRVGLARLVRLASTCIVVVSLPLWNVSEVAWLPWLALLWGIANLSMLKALLSYATTLVPVPGPRLVSMLLLGATLGTAISPALTSVVVEFAGSRAVLTFSSLCYWLLWALVRLAQRKTQEKTA